LNKSLSKKKKTFLVYLSIEVFTYNTMSKTILIIGSGGRESAIARKFSESHHVSKIIVSPGNAGTSSIWGGDKISSIKPESQTPQGFLQVAQTNKVDLVFIGPEAPLVDGTADIMIKNGIPCFGPTQAASKLEASKAYSKEFFQRYHLPTAQYITFSNYEEAVKHVQQVKYPVVIKASGLCAGKGVLIPEPGDVQGAISSLEAIMKNKCFGDAGNEVVIEELLLGQEVSVLAFCDGKTSVCMPPAQDHKRALDGDQGLNTGGMGAYAPAPCVDETTYQTIREIVQRTLNGLAQDGTPFIGVLFAGLMLTSKGPQLLEYNVRMGDPETEVVLPLLKSDLFEICHACVNGKLQEISSTIEWYKNLHAATVVIAAKGYPETYAKNIVLKGVELANKKDGVVVYHSGTTFGSKGELISNGGRILAVTGVGSTLKEAVGRAYNGVREISSEPEGQLHYRTDIAYRALGDSNNNNHSDEKRLKVDGS
jgi:phosphoribosylamine--glycine ligase/phosphoribosylformylglycinamidine cyclo-ligase